MNIIFYISQCQKMEKNVMFLKLVKKTNISLKFKKNYLKILLI